MSQSVLETWKVLGRVVGPWLPEQVLHFGPISVGPLPKGWPIAERGTLRAKGNGAASANSIPGGLELESSCFFWVDVEASDPGEAMQVAQERYVSVLEGALSLETYESGAHLAEPMSAACVSRGGTFQSQTEPVAAIHWQAAHLDATDPAKVLDDYGRMAGSAVARDAARHISRGRHVLFGLSDEPVVTETGLLSFFKAVERIANAFGPAVVPQLDDRRQEVLTGLARTLQGGGSAPKQATAVSRAARELAVLDRKHFTHKLQAAVEALQLSELWARDAREFVEFRNKHLGHASIGDPERLRRWWRVVPGELSAEVLARQMLAAYVHHAPA